MVRKLDVSHKKEGTSRVVIHIQVQIMIGEDGDNGWVVIHIQVDDDVVVDDDADDDNHDNNYDDEGNKQGRHSYIYRFKPL